MSANDLVYIAWVVLDGDDWTVRGWVYKEPGEVDAYTQAQASDYAAMGLKYEWSVY